MIPVPFSPFTPQKAIKKSGQYRLSLSLDTGKTGRRKISRVSLFFRTAAMEAISTLSINPSFFYRLIFISIQGLRKSRMSIA